MKGKGICVPVSQLDGNTNINFESSTSTSSTTLAVPVIEECVLHVRKTSEKIKKRRALAERTRQTAKKKSTK